MVANICMLNAGKTQNEKLIMQLLTNKIWPLLDERLTRTIRLDCYYDYYSYSGDGVGIEEETCLFLLFKKIQ